MTFLTFVWKNLIRRRLRLGLTTLGLGLAVCALVALVGLTDGFEESLKSLYRGRNVALVVQPAGGIMQLTRGVDERLQKPIEQIRGVREVLSGLVDVVALPQFDLYAVLINGWTPDSPVFDRVKLTCGRKLQAGDRDKILIGTILAANTQKQCGDTLELYGNPFEIVGVFEAISIYDNGSVYMYLDQLQRLTDRRGKVTAFLVAADEPDNEVELERIRSEIESIAPSLSASSAANFIRNLSQLRVARVVSWITSLVAVTIGLAGTLNTMMMSVFERVREIGVLRAVGWSKRRVVGLVLCEGLGISVLGAMLGLALGIFALRAFSHWPAASGLVEGSPPWSVCVQGFAMALVMGLLGAAYPAYWAARQLPVEALRAK